MPMFRQEILRELYEFQPILNRFGSLDSLYVKVNHQLATAKKKTFGSNNLLKGLFPNHTKKLTKSDKRREDRNFARINEHTCKVATWLLFCVYLHERTSIQVDSVRISDSLVRVHFLSPV